MLKQPNTKYRSFPKVQLADRTWPDRVITQAPIWMSTDLRDGNQALFEPMTAERKMRLFKKLVDIGIKEIEVAFPSASQTEFDFVRTLIDGGHVPADVTIEVLTQAREHLIRRTMASLYGARRAIVHVYNATARPFREIVFGMSPDQVIAMAVSSVKLVRELAEAHPKTEWVLEYSPEAFTGTELEFARDICDAVVEAWGATPERKVILNLPATVEMATPNVYADQIEWMHRNLSRRDDIVLSVHPHNDRGSAIAAAELALMAGAERVEGCLFGNGERTGNVDLVTLALNLYTQGVDPGLDFSNINDIARTVEDCIRLPIHPRHPYVGDLVFTAFSGSHQDAIKKGLAHQRPDAFWEVPYLPIDPADLGRSYDAIIRVNSQSGKGGIAYLLESAYGLSLPRRLQVEFSSVVQRHADATGAEIMPDELWRMFSEEYLEPATTIRYLEHHLFEHGAAQGMRLMLETNGRRITLMGEGNGPIDAVVHALGGMVRVQSYEERSMGQGSDARAAAFVEIAIDDIPGIRYGAGIHANIVTASVLAIVGALNRILNRIEPEAREAVVAMLEKSVRQVA
ncbi:2-isopropylmalate synthase 2 (alpha-isopropylmalatesynthase 2) (alpha-ipm synthetase 2) protein [Methylocaldum marinum]|uniref:2-isopropylmalate synthase n=1 Tax=Methylocaldum marinum TaxID=1432792 RepID=A0A250KX90_9GAMM|nr:2-isopropylmalate synthase 2 (alpha-isopropylmalatesynthase 2) (alpha-ipm synthetase 2) protein [Methylocaldum marinum]